MTSFSVEGLRGALDAFEACYGMSSEDFYAAHAEYDDARMQGICGFHRHVWASFYRDWRRLSGDARNGAPVACAGPG